MFGADAGSGLRLRVQGDGMAVWLVGLAASALSGPGADAEAIHAFLRKHKITHGVDEPRIAELASAQQAGKLNALPRTDEDLVTGDALESCIEKGVGARDGRDEKLVLQDE